MIIDPTNSVSRFSFMEPKHGLNGEVRIARLAQIQVQGSKVLNISIRKIPSACTDSYEESMISPLVCLILAY